MPVSARQSIGCLPPVSHAGVSSGSRQVCLPTRPRPSIASDISVPVSMPARDARLARIFGTLPAQSQFDRMEPRQVFGPRRNGEARALGLGHRRPAGLPLAGRRDGAQLRSRLPPQLNWRSYRISKCLDLCQRSHLLARNPPSSSCNNFLYPGPHRRDDLAVFSADSIAA